MVNYLSLLRKHQITPIIVDDRQAWARGLEKRFNIARDTECSCHFKNGYMHIDGGCKVHAKKIAEVNLYSKQRKLNPLWSV